MATVIRAFVLFLCWVLLLPSFGSIASAGGAQSPGLPSVKQVEEMRYEKANGGDQTDSLSYADLKDVVALAKAYSRGNEILPAFHEPIPTRGATGIAIFRAISPSVVLVVTGKVKDDKLTDVGIGTGVVVATGGYILTNWHVISGYESAAIFLKPTGDASSDDTAYGAKVVAQDLTTDLAILKLSKPLPNLKPVKLGDISSVQVAEDIHIIGHPHGHPWSYSSGVISQVRDPYTWQYDDKSNHSAKVLQMQTAINPGNSGGPVLDDGGNILGLVAMSEEGQNLDYAIAVDVIKAFVTHSLATETRGAQTRKAPPQSESFSTKTPEGLSVKKVVFSDLKTYLVRDSSDNAVELIAEASDGSTLIATKPNQFGGYSDWSIFLPTGAKVYGHSNGSMPEVMSSK